MIPSAIIAAWQRHCLEHPTGELTISSANALELLRIYAAVQAAPERCVERVFGTGTGMCIAAPRGWDIGDSVRLVRVDCGRHT
jgi:hypothetical protein